MRACLSLVLLVAIAGCGKVSLSGADSGPGGDGDGDAAVDPGNLLDPLSGTWTFWLENETNPSAECTVTFDADSFDVYCPSEPRAVGMMDCMQVKDDVHLAGTWSDAFQGSADTITRYEGTSCEAEGFAPVGQDIVDQGILTMDGTHDQTSNAAGFLNLAYGVWQWTAVDPDNAGDSIGCSATFGPADNEAGVTFQVECPEDPTTVNNCTTTSFIRLEGVLTASSLAAEGWDEDHNEGANCTEDPVVESTRTPMGANRM